MLRAEFLLTGLLQVVLEAVCDICYHHLEMVDGIHPPVASQKVVFQGLVYSENRKTASKRSRRMWRSKRNVATDTSLYPYTIFS